MNMIPPLVFRFLPLQQRLEIAANGILIVVPIVIAADCSVSFVGYFGRGNSLYDPGRKMELSARTGTSPNLMFKETHLKIGSDIWIPASV